ncbi:MAG: hypothetical protein IT518_18985 [Burkholderiales bacterium]|nr:hypothetical protein [Burkholderiales bacterium]
MTIDRFSRLAGILLALAAPAGFTQPASPPLTVDSLSWLSGCFAGTVNQRDFREQWMPLRGGVLLGIGSTVFQDKLQNYEYLRIEPRPDGVFYVALPSGQKEAAFKLTAAVATDDGATTFTFTNPEHDFPQFIHYRRGTEGWLYATVEGKLKGEERKVIYPMRRIDCESGELIHK